MPGRPSAACSAKASRLRQPISEDHKTHGFGFGQPMDLM
jgi:hypothetical protein